MHTQSYIDNINTNKIMYMHVYTYIVQLFRRMCLCSLHYSNYHFGQSVNFIFLCHYFRLMPPSRSALQRVFYFLSVFWARCAYENTLKQFIDKFSCIFKTINSVPRIFLVSHFVKKLSDISGSVIGNTFTTNTKYSTIYGVRIQNIGVIFFQI